MDNHLSAGPRDAITVEEGVRDVFEALQEKQSKGRRRQNKRDKVRQDVLNRIGPYWTKILEVGLARVRDAATTDLKCNIGITNQYSK